MEAVNSIEQETKAQHKNDVLRFVNGKLTNINKKRREKEKRLVENFLINDIHNQNEGLYQEYLKKHFESYLLVTSFSGEYICLKFYIHFKCEEERLLLFTKRGERNKKINREKTRKFPPFNCKGNKGILVQVKTSRTKKENFVSWRT